MAPERAAALALSELRLPANTPAMMLEDLLPRPEINPVENDLSRNARPFVAALAGACPRLAPAANVLPPEHRRYSSRALFIPSIVLASVALLVAGSVVAYASWSEKRYLSDIQAEILRLEPLKKKSDAMERQIAQARAKAQLLDQFQQQTRKDLDALNEVTRLIEPPAWTNMLTLARDGLRIGGEAPQTAALVKILDGSPYFEGTTVLISTPGGHGEGFGIRANRRAGK